MTTPAQPASRLDRRLGLGDAVVIGLGAMIGAGVFSAIGPAAGVAGSGLLLGLAVAAAVAFCNATSSAELAARYPEAGGTYVYGRRRLGHGFGYLAGWCFVVGKTSSCAAMALTFGAYALPDHARWAGVLAVAALAAVNLAGVSKSALATRAILVVVLATLGIVIVACLGGGTASTDNLGPVLDTSPRRVLESAGLLFFSFAGYARIATLGEEVRDPARTIRRAVPIALGCTLVVYVAVAASALLAAGPDALAGATAPLATAVRSGDLDSLDVFVRVGGTVAAAGVLLSLLLGISRTVFAMAAERDLPPQLAAVHPRTRVPHRAEVAIAVAVIALATVVDLRDAVGFSSFTVLVYYAVANAAALTLHDGSRSKRVIAAAGLGGCLLLAVTLPRANVVAGCVVVAIGLTVFAAMRLAKRLR